MIKIRYRDLNELSPGLHAAAERHGRNTMVYLLSGLTAQQRRAALRRLRLCARMGHGPALPTAQLALALLVDRVRTGVGQAGAVFRLHPAGSTLPVMVVSAGAIAFLLFSTVSIRVLHPQSSDQLQAAGPLPVASAGTVPVPNGSRGQLAGGSGGPGGPGDTGQSGSGSGPLGAAPPGSSVPTINTAPAIPALPAGGAAGSAAGPDPGTSGSGTSPGSAGPGSTGPGSAGTGSAGTGSAGSASAGSPSGGSGGSAGSGTSPSAPQAAAASTAPPAAASQGAAPSQTPAAPQPTPSASTGGGVCLDVGPLGVCLNL